MPYTLFKLLSGGTFTTGISADWRAQFSASTIISARPTMAGEIVYPGAETTFGVYAAYALRSRNPYDQTICVPEASAGAPVQVYMNGMLVAEVRSPGTVICSAISGMNLFEVVRGQAPLVVMPAGPFIDPLGQTGRWVSLYPPGSDPFEGSGSGSGLKSTNPSFV